jgi:hypothetical protein
LSCGIDAFVFERLRPPFEIGSMPPFRVGRPKWDFWVVRVSEWSGELVSLMWRPPLYHMNHPGNPAVHPRVGAFNYHEPGVRKNHKLYWKAMSEWPLSGMVGKPGWRARGNGRAAWVVLWNGSVVKRQPDRICA